jgi:PAS domain S-box-containing protein
MNAQELWEKLTAPQSPDEDTARREYATKVILVILSAVAIGALLPIFIAWIFQLVPLDMLIEVAILGAIFGGSYAYAYRGLWRWGSYVLPAFVFLVAVYLNYNRGMGSVTMLVYAIAILLTTMLHGVGGRWLMLGLSVVAYSGLGWAYHSGALPPAPPPESTFTILALGVSSSLTVIALLQGWHDGQFQRALARARSHTDELQAANVRLEQEMAERAQAERALRASERQLRDIASNIPGAIYQFKLTTDGEQSFPYVSASWEELFGLSPEIAQRDADAVFAKIMPEDLSEIHRKIEISAQTLSPWRCEFRAVVDEDIKWIAGSAVPALQEDGTILWNGVLLDISAQKGAELEYKRLQQETIYAQQQALRELASPVIPVMDGIIVMPLVGGIDSQRAQDMMRRVLEGVSEHNARVVILDVTGVPAMDIGIVNHLNKTLQAARLKGAHVIVTGISDAVAEAIVDGDWGAHGVDWGAVETRRDLQTGLRVALGKLSIKL